LQEYNIRETIFDQYEKHDYHIINIKDVELGALLEGSNYQNIFFSTKTKETIFALFIGGARSY
jgi:hypothetical protein